MKRFPILLLALILLVGGGYFGFKVFEIELKARAYQPLLQYAWQKTIKTGKDQRPCCLLYTSPSPRDATLSRMPSSA